MESVILVKKMDRALSCNPAPKIYGNRQGKFLVQDKKVVDVGLKGRDPDKDCPRWMQTPFVKQKKEPGLQKQSSNLGRKLVAKRTRNKGKEVSLGRKKK